LQDVEDEPLFAGHAAGIDIGKATVMATIRVPGEHAGSRSPAGDPGVQDRPPGAGGPGRMAALVAGRAGGHGGHFGYLGSSGNRLPRMVTARFVRSFLHGGRVICRAVRDADSRPQSASGHYPSSLPLLPIPSQTRTRQSYLREQGS